MAMIPMEYDGGGIVKSDTFSGSTNSAGAIDIGGNVSSKILLSAKDSSNAYRLIPWVRNDGLNYIQCLNSSWAPLAQDTSVSGTYYYIEV